MKPEFKLLGVKFLLRLTAHQGLSFEARSLLPGLPGNDRQVTASVLASSLIPYGSVLARFQGSRTPQFPDLA